MIEIKPFGNLVEEYKECAKIYHDIDIWVAHHILKHMNYTRDIERKALSIIKREARKNTIEGLIK